MISIEEPGTSGCPKASNFPGHEMRSTHSEYLARPDNFVIKGHIPKEKKVDGGNNQGATDLLQLCK